MKNLIKNYRQLLPQKKASYSSLISVIFNGIMALGKFVMAIFKGVFFFVSGCINIFFLLCKFECYYGLKNYNNKSFKYGNIKVATYLLLAGVEYTIYMLGLLVGRREVMAYGPVLAIGIATIAFVELGFAICGLFTIKDKGHYYRDIKLINFSSALTALMWAEVALISFASETKDMLVCGITGVIVGTIIIILSIYIYFAPKVSLVDREYNVYKHIKGQKQAIEMDENNNVKIVLYKSKFYGDCVYNARCSDTQVEGKVTREKPTWWKSLNIYWKIMVVILSEILIFAYGIGALVYFFKTIKLIPMLDAQMKEKGYRKVNSVE